MPPNITMPFDLDPAMLEPESVSHIFARAAKTHALRTEVYGSDAVGMYGRVMADLFPEGLVITRPEDWARFGLFTMVVAKLTRYAESFTKGGHPDSIHDLGVYAFMLESEDQKHA